MDEVLQPSLNANKNILWSSMSGLFNSITGLPLKKRKKKLKPTKSKTQALGRQFAATSARITRIEKKQGPHCPEHHFSPDFHLMFFCYFNFTTSKWGENRLIVSMSLDCDQRHTKQFQNLQQPQLWGEDGDEFTNSFWNGFQSQDSQTRPAMPG